MMKPLNNSAGYRRIQATAFVGCVVLGLAAAVQVENASVTKTGAQKVTVEVAPAKAAPPAFNAVLTPSARKIPTHTVDVTKASFDALGFELRHVREGTRPVPRILPTAVPSDMSAIEDAQQRKRVFLRMVLPLVLVTNEQLVRDRQRITLLRDAIMDGRAVSYRQQTWLEEQFATYKVEPGDFETLLRRVDIVPPSLALAQAAIESGWGTSRFARLGNALFGQWTTAQHEGIVPARREEGKTHKIRAFDAPLDAVKSYVRNLNTHAAYRELREMRAAFRAESRAFDSIAFADTLHAYSEKGTVYTDLLKQIIRGNKLRMLDRAILSPQEPRIALGPRRDGGDGYSPGT